MRNHKRGWSKARYDRRVWWRGTADLYRCIRVCPRCGAANVRDEYKYWLARDVPAHWPPGLCCLTCGARLGNYLARGEHCARARARRFARPPALRYARRKGRRGGLVVEQVRWNGRKYVRERVVC